MCNDRLLLKIHHNYVLGGNLQPDFSACLAGGSGIRMTAFVQRELAPAICRHFQVCCRVERLLRQRPQCFAVQFKAFADLFVLEAVVVPVCILVTYFKTGLVPNFPTLIVCGFTAIAALISFFTGLQLQNAVQKNKQDFEMERIRANWRYRKDLGKLEDLNDAE